MIDIAAKIAARKAMAERDRQIVAAYLAGETMVAVGARHGLTKKGIAYIVHKAGVPADRSRGGKQAAAAARARWSDPEWRARTCEALWAKCSAWPECPPELRDDYRQLRRYMKAAEARAVLEGAS